MRFPRRIRLDSAEYGRTDTVFHLVIRAHPRLAEWQAGVGQAIWECIIEQRAAQRVDLLAACLMPDHVHLVVRPRTMDVLRFVNVWKSWTTRRAWQAGQHHELWQPGMWDRVVRSGADLERTVEYIVRNPVEAQLVDSVEAWPWIGVWLDKGTPDGAEDARGCS